MQNGIARGVKAFAACAACVGVILTPEQIANISAGFLAVYSAVSAIQATLFSKDEK